MTRKQQIEAQFREAQRQYAAGELPLPDENDPTGSWPLDKYCVWLFNDPDGGPELLEVFCERGIKFEDLVDTAAELERRHFPHVAAVLRKVAENAPSQVDDEIERDDAYRRKYGPAQGLKDRGYWYVARFLQGRERITGQSRDELVAFYGLEEWLGIADNGAERMH